MGDKLQKKDFIFVPIEEATSSPGGIVMCYRDQYWSVCEEQILFFNPMGRNGRRSRRDGGSAQCNGQEGISRAVSEIYDFPVEVRLIPFVFRKVNPSDYC